MKLTLASAQLEVSTESEPTKSKEKCLQFCDDAGNNDADLLVLPEMSFQPFFPAYIDSTDELPDDLITLGDETFQSFKEAADRNDLVLVVPLCAWDRRNDGVFSSAAVIDSNGELEGIYHRVHGNSSEGVSESWLSLGDELPVFETEIGTIGIMLGHDRHFPEQSRILGVNGADIICVPSAAYGEHHDTWALELRAHTVAHGVFVVSANRVGKIEGLSFFGESMVIDPRGKVSSKLGNDENLLTETVDSDEIREVRDLWQFFRDRRPETYTSMVEK